MASSLYYQFKKELLSGLIDLAQSDIKVMLLSGTYDGSTSSNKINHWNTGHIADGHEVCESLGYTEGGELLTDKTFTIFGTTAGAFGTTADTSWATSTITASGAAIYQSGATVEESYLIAYIDFAADHSSSNGQFLRS